MKLTAIGALMSAALIVIKLSTLGHYSWLTAFLPFLILTIALPLTIYLAMGLIALASFILVLLLSK